MLKSLLPSLILLTLVQTDELPEIKLPVAMVLMIALSIRIVNKWSRKTLTPQIFCVMIFNAVALFYLMLIGYKNWGIDKNPIIEAFGIGLLSNEIVNEVIKLWSHGFRNWLKNWANLIAAKDERN